MKKAIVIVAVVAIAGLVGVAIAKHSAAEDEEEIEYTNFPS